MDSQGAIEQKIATKKAYKICRDLDAFLVRDNLTYGKLLFNVKNGGNVNNNDLPVLVHSYSFLEQSLEGKIRLPIGGICKEGFKFFRNYIRYVDEKRVAANLAFALSYPFPKYFSDKDFDSYEPIKPSEIEKLVTGIMIFGDDGNGNEIEKFSEERTNKKVLSSQEEKEFFKSFNFYKGNFIEKAKKIITSPIFKVKKSDVLDMVSNYNASRIFINTLLFYNIGLLKKFSKKYSKKSLRFANSSELFSLFVERFITCAEKFNYLLDYKFSSYICSAMNNEFKAVSLKKFRKNSFFENIEDLSRDDINLLQQKVREEEIIKLRDLLERENTVLLNREREILRSRYGIDTERQTLSEIGKRLNITRERVRQIENDAKLKLRKVFEEF